MAALGLVVFQALVLAPLAAPRAHSGEEVHCIQDQAHLVRFNLTGAPGNGSSLAHIESANVTLEPSAAHAAHCRDRLGFQLDEDVAHCWGVNQDAGCQRAKADVPLQYGLECKNCFAAASLSAVFHLGISHYKLDSLTVGVKGLQLHASASISKGLSGSKVFVNHSVPMPGNDARRTLVNITVGCPLCVPVEIAVAVTNTLDYAVQGSDGVKFRAGVELDADFGNSLVSYVSGRGWSHEIPRARKLSAKPILVDGADGDAELNIGLSAAVNLTVERLGWLQVAARATMPGQLTTDANVSKRAKMAEDVCLDAKAHALATQEADLNVTVGLWAGHQHWGPTELANELVPLAHKCKHMPGANETATLLV